MAKTNPKIDVKVRPTVAVEIDGLWWKLQDECRYDKDQAVMIAPGGSKTAIPKALLDEYVRLRLLELAK